MKIVVIHFSPVELYPPVQNLLNVLGSKKDLNVTLLTTRLKSGLGQFTSPSDAILIKRLTRYTDRLGALRRMLIYFTFNLRSLIYLVATKPESVFYFETLSSWSPIVYKRYFNRKVNLFIHYHEYTSPAEYDTGMMLNRWLHREEKKIYTRSLWVSHTNLSRMTLFENDIVPYKASGRQILPNYPPRHWHREPKTVANFPIKVIYVGSLSLTTMFVIEFANWVESQNGKVIWDVYSHNFTSSVSEFFQRSKCKFVNFKPPIQYRNLPDLLSDYDVGVILYKGHIPNYVYNAPNKLFEYLACGLDVWFPSLMIGSLPYATSNTYPKVIPLDFSSLPEVEKLVDRTGLKYKMSTYFAEEALAPLVDKLTQKGLI